MRVQYKHFWEGFDPINFPLTFFISKAIGEKVSIVDSRPDIEIHSVFKHGPDSRTSPKDRMWFYTGENVRPDYDAFATILSFDFSNRKNAFRLPLWWNYLDWSLAASDPKLVGGRINPYRLHEPRALSTHHLERTVSVFIGNLTELRAQAIRQISPTLKIARFGSAFKNPVGSLLDFRSKFAFNLCFENSYFPGYHTEKLLNAYMMESVPLYYGSRTVSLDFNSDAFINLADYKSIEAFWDYVENLDEEDIAKLISQPLVRSPLSINSFLEFIHSSLSQNRVYV